VGNAAAKGILVTSNTQISLAVCARWPTIEHSPTLYGP
jgi:hypothetical protein